MPISLVDYEPAPVDPEELPAAEAVPRAEREAAAADSMEPAAQALAGATSAVAAAMAELVKQTNALEQWTARQTPASNETDAALPPQRIRPAMDTAGDAGRDRENSLPHDRTLPAEKEAAQTGAGSDAPPEAGQTERPLAGTQQVIPPSQAPPEEQDENDAGPEWPGGGSGLQNRFDAARGRLNNQTQDATEQQALLEQAVTLLETLARQEALADYAALKQRLDNIEQILNSSDNVR
jgi:hypothetical protein